MFLIHTMLLMTYHTGVERLQEIAVESTAVQLANYLVKSYALSGKSLRIMDGDSAELGNPIRIVFFTKLCQAFIDSGVTIVEREAPILHAIMYESIDSAKISNKNMASNFDGAGGRSYRTADRILKVDYKIRIKQTKQADSVFVRVLYRLDEKKGATIVYTDIVDYIYEFKHTEPALMVQAVKEEENQLLPLEFFSQMGYHGNLQFVKLIKYRSNGVTGVEVKKVYTPHFQFVVGIYKGSFGLGIDWVFASGLPDETGRIAKFTFFGDKSVNRSFGFRTGVGFLFYRDQDKSESSIMTTPEIYLRFPLTRSLYIELSPGFTLNLASIEDYTSFHLGVNLGYRRLILPPARK